jgi:hypothetical protein
MGLSRPVMGLLYLYMWNAGNAAWFTTLGLLHFQCHTCSINAVTVRTRLLKYSCHMVFIFQSSCDIFKPVTYLTPKTPLISSTAPNKTSMDVNLKSCFSSEVLR